MSFKINLNAYSVSWRHWELLFLTCFKTLILLHGYALSLLLTWFQQTECFFRLISGALALQGTSGKVWRYVLIVTTGEWVLTDIKWAEGGDASNIPQCTEQSPITKNYLAHNVNNFEVEKFWLTLHRSVILCTSLFSHCRSLQCQVNCLCSI